MGLFSGAAGIIVAPLHIASKTLSGEPIEGIIEAGVVIDELFKQ